MNYRIFLMASGLLMMFAVYGFVMMIGAMVGNNDAVSGNTIISLIFTVLTLVMFRLGMSQRKKAHALFQSVIDREIADHGYIDALRFSQGAGVSLDDARDILNRRATSNRWMITELDGYNAEYRPS